LLTTFVNSFIHSIHPLLRTLLRYYTSNTAMTSTTAYEQDKRIDTTSRGPSLIC
jgi:hypothetical protein